MSTFKEDQSSIYATSLSDYSSLGQRVLTNRQQMLQKQTARLRHQNAQLANKHMKAIDQLSKLKIKLSESQRKNYQTDEYYKREIENLQKQLSEKNRQLNKYVKQKSRRSHNLSSHDLNKQNLTPQTPHPLQQSYISNQSLIAQGDKGDREGREGDKGREGREREEKVMGVVGQAIRCFEPYVQGKQFEAMFKKLKMTVNELGGKHSISGTLTKSNQILEEIKTKNGNDGETQIGKLFCTLKNKTKTLGQMTFVCDYDVESETKQLESLLQRLDTELKAKKIMKEKE